MAGEPFEYLPHPRLLDRTPVSILWESYYGAFVTLMAILVFLVAVGVVQVWQRWYVAAAISAALALVVIACMVVLGVRTLLGALHSLAESIYLDHGALLHEDLQLQRHLNYQDRRLND